MASAAAARLGQRSGATDRVQEQESSDLLSIERILTREQGTNGGSDSSFVRV